MTSSADWWRGPWPSSWGKPLKPPLRHTNTHCPRRLAASASHSHFCGVNAFDLISHGAMIQGLMRVDGGSEAVPFVRMVNGTPSEYLWEDSQGVVHTIPQGEGGEQGDPLTPLLIAVGQHQALEAVKDQLSDRDHLLACLMTRTKPPNQRGRVILAGVWKLSCGIEPRFVSTGARPKYGIVRVSDPQSAMSLRGELEQLIRQQLCGGSEVPCHQQELKVLGNEFGHPEWGISWKR